MTPERDPGLPTCEEVITFLWAYLSNELEPEKAAAFERHLERCDSCVSYLETYREAIALTRGAFDEEAGEELPEELVRAVLAAGARGTNEDPHSQ